MNKQQEIKIAKNVFAMTYGQLQELYDRYESPDIMDDIMQDLKRFSKLVTNETVLKNNKEWWKIWKNDLNPTDIQDELLDAIAHKVFLNSLKIISGIIEVKEKFDDLQVENINFANMTKKQIDQLIEQCKEIAKKFKYVKKNKPKLINFLTKMKSNSSTLDKRYQGDDRYEMIVKNKAVEKLLNDLKSTLDDVITELQDSEEYKLEAPAITPRVKKSSLIKEAKVPQEGYEKALQNLIENAREAISTGNYRQENPSENKENENKEKPSENKENENKENSSENNKLDDKLELLKRIDGKNVDFPQTLKLINAFVNEKTIADAINSIRKNKTPDKLKESLKIKQTNEGKEITLTSQKDIKEYLDTVFEPSRVQYVAEQIIEFFNKEIFNFIVGKNFSKFYQHLDQFIKNNQKIIKLFKEEIIKKFNSGFKVDNNNWFNDLANNCMKNLINIKKQFEKELENIDQSMLSDVVRLRTVKSYDSKKDIFIAMKIAKSLMK